MAFVETSPSPLAPGALALLKQAAGITDTRDDALLLSELRSQIALCEAFVGQILIARDVEEHIAVRPGWQTLRRVPVLAITGAFGVPSDGDEFALPISGYEIDITRFAAGRVRVLQPGSASRVRMVYRAGLAEHWDGVPWPLRGGIIRAAVHSYRTRFEAPDAAVPASVAALWRPWRIMRLERRA